MNLRANVYNIKQILAENINTLQHCKYINRLTMNGVLTKLLVTVQ